MVQQRYMTHIHHAILDRRVDSRIQDEAALSVASPHIPKDLGKDILNFTIDAMEQAKFKLPRHPGCFGECKNGLVGGCGWVVWGGVVGL